MIKLKYKVGGVYGKNDGSLDGIKLEPAFLTENEEALLAAGYVKNKTQSGFYRGEFQGGNNYRGGYYKTQVPNWSQENTRSKSRSSN